MDKKPSNFEPISNPSSSPPIATTRHTDGPEHSASDPREGADALVSVRGNMRTRRVLSDLVGWWKRLALALVACSPEQLPLLVLAHLLAPFLDHVAHGESSS